MIHADYRSPIQKVWGLVTHEKVQTTAKVIVVAALLYNVYRMYQTIQSLQGKVDALEKSNTKLRTDLNELKQKHDEFFNEYQEVIGNELYHATSFIDPMSESPIEPKKPPKALEILKEKFPGRHFACTYTLEGKEHQTNLADFLCMTFLRLEEKPSCDYKEETNTYTLKYKDTKTVTIHALPQVIWDRAKAKSYLLYGALWALINIKPQLQMGEEIELQLIETEHESTICILNSSISLVPKMGYTGCMKMIVIPKNQNKVYIESEHNLRVENKGGHLEAQTIVETVAPFFLGQ